MKDSYMAVLDSGIGGISVLERLIKLLPNEKFLYFGDNKNAPYGNKSEKELLLLTLNNLNYLFKYRVKQIVFACNTLSVKVLPLLHNYINHDIDISYYGTMPPIELSTKNPNEKTILLCTCATEEFYKEKSGNSNLVIIGFSDLAKDIEENKFNLERVNFQKHLYKEIEKRRLKLDKIDNVILGCTHYHFIKNQILDHFRPKKIFDGGEITANKLLLDVGLTRITKKDSKNQVIFIGDNKRENKRFFQKWLTIQNLQKKS